MAFPMDELDSSRRPDARTPRPRCSATSCCARRFAKDQAKTAGHGLIDELHLLTTHGVLHLLG